MPEHRLHGRVDCVVKCNLHRGCLYYPAMVKNISPGGVLVTFYVTHPNLRVGDNCEVYIGGENLRQYSCEIVRVQSLDVALKFIDTHTL